MIKDFIKQLNQFKDKYAFSTVKFYENSLGYYELIFGTLDSSGDCYEEFTITEYKKRSEIYNEWQKLHELLNKEYVRN